MKLLHGLFGIVIVGLVSIMTPVRAQVDPTYIRTEFERATKSIFEGHVREGTSRLSTLADLETGRSLVSHPRRKAGKGAVKLVHDKKRDAALFEPPPNAHKLAKAGMKSVGDTRFSLMFAGSISPFRATLESRECPCRARADRSQSYGEANAAGPSAAGPSCAAPRLWRPP